MNKINKCFEEFSEYQDSLSTNKGVIGVDRSEILDIKAGWCNNLHKQEHIDPDQEEKYGISIKSEVVQASA